MEQKMDTEPIREKLKEWFAKRLPQAEEITLSPLIRPRAGASAETVFSTLEWREGDKALALKLVIRWPPFGFRVYLADAYDMTKQFRRLQRLHNTDVPVPRVHWLEEDPSVIGVPFYVMEEVEGWIPGDFPSYHASGPLFESSEEERAEVWWNAIDTIAKIHKVDWCNAGLDFLSPSSGGSGFIESQISYYDEIFRKNDEPMPSVLVKTRDWLLKNSFTPKRLTLCWYDARLGNMIFRGNKVVAVLDWEGACIGDPESDLGWLSHVDWCTSLGHPASPVPRLTGLPSMANTIAHYEKVTQTKVENFDYWEVFATYRLSICFTRLEHNESYLARSGNKKGFVTRPQFEKLQRLLKL